MHEEKSPLEAEIIIIVVLFILVALSPVIISYASSYFGHSLDNAGDIVAFVAARLFGWILGISIPISILLLIGIVASVEGTKHVRRKEAALYDAHVEIAYDATVKGDPALTRRWQSVTTHADSPNQSDWRQAIIEADIILGDILTKMGYQGAGIGEQLKGATAADFNTLDQAWEAHKIRNQIAHEGSDFALSQHEAKRVVNLYRQVFEEFFYI